MAFGRDTKFSFQHLPDRTCKFMENRETRDMLQKWSLLGGMKLTTFAYDQFFQIYNKDCFFSDFFSSPAVGSSLQVVGSSRSWQSIGCHKEVFVEATHVPCTVLKMDFFDRLSECGVVRPSGDIRKCFDEFLDDFTISDELRKVLLLEDFEHFSIFSGDDRKEFIFRLFSHLCLGGSVCQYEDTIDPYLDITKTLYKDLISVVKETKTSELRIGSIVFKISAKSQCMDIFPSSYPHTQSFAYAIIDPVKRHVTIWQHDWSFGF